MTPLVYMGEGQFQAPKAFAARCDRQFVIGETLRWEVVNERSSASHNHYFACIADAWANIPEHLTSELPSPDHLRGYCLIKAGYCDIHKIVCTDEAEAIRAALLMKSLNTFTICEVIGCVVTVYRAKSQSVKAMGAKEFGESKQAVFAEIGKLIGIDPTELGKAA